MDFSFILIRPQYPENIGSTARAIKTMGFSDLRLVNPCDHLCKEAKWLAHGSIDILEKAKVFSHVNEALNGIDFTVGTSAKKRSVKVDYIPSQELNQFFDNKMGTVQSVAVLFGCEESGLPNEILHQCDIVSYVPLEKLYPSLNLSQAVMIYAYSLSSIAQKKLPPTKSNNEQSYYALKNKVTELLNNIDITNDQLKYHRIFERLAHLKSEDINLLHSILNNLQENLMH